MLILKYERKDFFGESIYVEDSKENYGKTDLKKVFLFLSKTYNAAVQIESDVIFWDSLKEYENRIVTVRKHDGTSYDESKESFEKAKKECYAVV